ISRRHTRSKRDWSSDVCSSDLDGDESRQYRLCAHVESPAACNWLIPAESEATLCIACSLNRTSPNLESEQNQLYWRRLETAKRRSEERRVGQGKRIECTRE